eukprot:10691287-Alexandrium_andersonii.AAC.1
MRGPVPTRSFQGVPSAPYTHSSATSDSSTSHAGNAEELLHRGQAALEQGEGEGFGADVPDQAPRRRT